MRIDEKSLTVKKLGWRGNAKRIECFGWELQNADLETETTTETTYETEIIGDTEYTRERTTESTKVRVHLYFLRYRDKFQNLRAIFLPELIFNLVFLIRRLVGFFLPLAFGLFAIIALMGQSTDDIGQATLAAAMSLFGVWLLLKLAESILALIAKKLLKLKVD